MNPFRSILPPVLRVMAMACVAVAMAGCASTPVAATTGAHPELRRYDEEWFDAARIGRVDILQTLVAAGYPIDATTHEGYTAVILAAYRHQPEALEYLLRTGANACTGDQHGNTALMGVLFKGDTALARRLIQTHCPIDQTNNAGETALAFAALFGRVDLVPQLVAHGANLEHADELGRTALQIAVQQGNATTIAALEKAGAQHVPDPAMYNHP
ncbi:ankyrin repeat domain-containing protein [Paraburkholderia sp. Ac-20342]|nr:ankyrin repeat domain-containing protein [Paraburkholderia sp. Ac-20342]NIF54049.1 ankyrin repeat domain-containing protein [Burkholderia sp. Ax-1724]NIF81615.1 ankyrin repeat domain-containing protein [Paraburkholderia sp. Cy-641]